MTRKQPDLRVVEGGLTCEIAAREGTVRVALSGILDRRTLAAVRRRVDALLWQRGRRIVLDGARLIHVDYRAVADLLAWRRDLAPYGHRLLLSRWSSYLRTILLLGAGAEPTGGRRPGQRLRTRG